MDFKRRLPIPKEIKERYPLSSEGAGTRDECTEAIKAVLRGDDGRLLVIIGPCSADNPAAVYEYLSRLDRVREKVRDSLLIVPRIYTQKPRTSGNAYKGLIHKPDPHGQTDILQGVVAVREMHLRALEDYGFGTADEMLYPESLRFVSDLLCYVTVGARSADDQSHRLVASGLDQVVGIKNPMNGDLKDLGQAVKTARNGHIFIYRNWEVESHGNPYAHAVLRGYTDADGVMHNNISCASALESILGADGIECPAILVDCNHANSGKDYLLQESNALEALKLRNNVHSIKGLMIESYLEDGAQCESGTTFGQSITDPCLGWNKTEKLLYKLAEQ